MCAHQIGGCMDKRLVEDKQPRGMRWDEKQDDAYLYVLNFIWFILLNEIIMNFNHSSYAVFVFWRCMDPSLLFRLPHECKKSLSKRTATSIENHYLSMHIGGISHFSFRFPCKSFLHYLLFAQHLHRDKIQDENRALTLANSAKWRKKIGMENKIASSG